MAQKLLTSEEAAKLMGISVDDLNAMRERRQVFGIRDGSSWKYKQQDVERALEDLKGGGSGIGMPMPDDQESDSVLLSEVELGDPLGSASMSGTVIGKPGVLSPIDSDIELFDMDDKRSGSSATSDSDVELVPDLGGGSPIDSDVRLVAREDAPAAGPGSDIGGTVELELSDLSLDDDDTDLPFDLGSSLGSSAIADSKLKKVTEGLKPDSGIQPGSIKPDSGIGSDLTLGTEEASSISFDSGLSLADEPRGEGPSSSSPVDSAIELGGSAFEDDDLVLGSHTGSDISDSGISLASPADSGLSLEQPLELGGDEMSLDEGSGTTGELMADDEFLLTPAVEMGEEDLDESGSQVIALDTEGDFDDSAATMLGDAGAVGMLEEDAGAVPALDMTTGAVMAAPTMATMQPVFAREAPYSVFNVISLMACALFLMLTGMFMFDLMRNMWSWEGPYTFNSSMMDGIISMFEQ